ncbi:MAG: hypothetical protein M1120_02225 [Patescibacteria group bacterium]|nr:hypothetical protein [Patescibacteria group bacterium]
MNYKITISHNEGQLVIREREKPSGGNETELHVTSDKEVDMSQYHLPNDLQAMFISKGTGIYLRFGSDPSKQALTDIWSADYIPNHQYQPTKSRLSPVISDHHKKAGYNALINLNKAAQKRYRGVLLIQKHDYNEQYWQISVELE